MAVGSNNYKGLAVPLYGEFEQVGQTTANDQVTWTAKGGATGDLMVWRSSAGTEYMFIAANGDVEFVPAASGATGGFLRWDNSSQRLLFNQSSIVDSAKFNLTGGTDALTTSPVQNLAPGDVFLVAAIGVTTMRLGVCTTGNTVRYGASFTKAITSAS